MARYGDEKLVHSPVLVMVQQCVQYLNYFLSPFTICFLGIKMAPVIPTEPYTLHVYMCSFELVMHLFCVYPGGKPSSVSALNRGNSLSANGHSASATHTCWFPRILSLLYCFYNARLTLIDIVCLSASLVLIYLYFRAGLFFLLCSTVFAVVLQTSVVVWQCL